MLDNFHKKLYRLGSFRSNFLKFGCFYLGTRNKSDRYDYSSRIIWFPCKISDTISIDQAYSLYIRYDIPPLPVDLSSEETEYFKGCKAQDLIDCIVRTILQYQKVFLSRHLVILSFTKLWNTKWRDSPWQMGISTSMRLGPKLGRKIGFSSLNRWK